MSHTEERITFYKFEYLAMRQAAKLAVRYWPRARFEDVQAELHLYACQNFKYIVQWRSEGQHGLNKLHLTLRRRANVVCRQDHNTIRPPSEPGVEYGRDVVRAALREMLNRTDWSEIVPDGDSDAWAILTDISIAFGTLNKQDQAILQARLGDDLTYEGVAERMKITPSAARMRANRAMDRCAWRASEGTVRWLPGVPLDGGKRRAWFSPTRSEYERDTWKGSGRD